MSSYSTSTFAMCAASPAPRSIYRQGSYQPPKAPTQRPGGSPLTNKPRWSSTVNVRSVSTPVSVRGNIPGLASNANPFQFHTPLGRQSSVSPTLPTPLTARRSSQQYRSFAERVTSPTSSGAGGLLDPVPYHRGRNAPAPPAGTIRSPSSMGMHLKNAAPAVYNLPARPASSLNRSYASHPPRVVPSRKSSVMPQGTFQTSISHDRLRSAAELPASHSNPECRSEEVDQVPETEPTSSPQARIKTTTPRPGSSSTSGPSSKGRRISMLPVPTGRTSSMGHRVGT